MRTAIFGMLVALASLPAAAGAQSARSLPAATQSAPAAARVGPLAANEILFEIIVTGTARTRADRSLVSVVYMSRGADSAAAQRAAQELRARLVAVAARFQAAPTEMGSPYASGGVGWSVYVDDANHLPDPPRSESRAHGELLLELGDTTAIAQLRAALDEAGADTVTGPFHQLQDETQARRQARADALARARADADAFARPQNLRVVRLLRFSETSDAIAVMRAMNMIGRSEAESAEVETQLSAEVAFALAPQ